MCVRERVCVWEGESVCVSVCVREREKVCEREQGNIVERVDEDRRHRYQHLHYAFNMRVQSSGFRVEGLGSSI